MIPNRVVKKIIREEKLLSFYSRVHFELFIFRFQSFLYIE